MIAMKQCPKCGADAHGDPTTNDRPLHLAYHCGTTLVVNGDEKVEKMAQTDACTIRQLRLDLYRFKSAVAKSRAFVGRAFFDFDRKPILPEFCKPGDDIFEAVLKLARRYKIMEMRGLLTEDDAHHADSLAAVDIEFCYNVILPKSVKAIEL